MIEWLLGEIGLILAFGLLFGAGVPVLFALEVRSLARADRPEVGASARWWFRARAWACFGLAVLIIAAALGLVVASSLGYTLSFGQWPPGVVRKH